MEEADVTFPSKHPQSVKGTKRAVKCCLSLSLGGDVAHFKFLFLISGNVLNLLHLE